MKSDKYYIFCISIIKSTKINQVITKVGVHIGDNKLVVTTGRKTFHFDLHKDVVKNLKHEIDSVIKHDELLAKHTIKKQIRQLLSKYKHGNNIHEHGKQ